MLINLQEALKIQHHLVAFNFYNLETLTGILNAAKKTNKIVIAAFGESYINHMPLSVAAAMARELADAKNLKIVLHLDHAVDFKVIREAAEVGFTSIMYDGSKESLENNIKNSTAVKNLIMAKGISVEGELGYLNKEDGSDEVSIIYTEPADVKKYAEETRVEAIAVAVGNAHGLYRQEPKINLDLISRIAEVTDTPLVLHGSSGIPKAVIVEAFARGIRKINVNTELALAGSEAAYQYIQNYKGKARFENVMLAATEAMERVAIEFLLL